MWFHVVIFFLLLNAYVKVSVRNIIRRVVIEINMSLIRIATRNSPLALWQANYVKEQLQKAHSDIDVDIIGMTTKGDQMLDRSLSAVGGKGLFLKELEVSLLNNDTDIAVHSMKDVPVEMPKGLEIPVVCEREDARDAFVSNDYQNLYALPRGARVGTSSLRRVSQLKHSFPAFEFVELRGNVNTRLQKLDDGEYDAIILATAGLIRLGFQDRIKQYISSDLCLPAVGQGIVGIQCRVDDQRTRDLIAPLHNRISEICLVAERAMNATLDGGCQVPVAGYAELTKGKINLRGAVAKEDGSTILSVVKTSVKMTVDAAAQLGNEVANELLDKGAGNILDAVYDQAKEKQERELQEALIAKQEAELNLDKNKKLVVMTRQTRYLGNMPDILERLDYQSIHIATLKIDLRIRDDVTERLARLNDYTDIVFVSRNAVEIGMPLINKYGGLPEHIRALAVGAETAKQLYRFGVDAMFPEAGSGAEALLKVNILSDLTNRKVLIVRGDNSLVWPEEKMRNRGAEVENLVVYYQTAPLDCKAKLDAIFRSDYQVGGIFVHSSQSIINLIESSGEYFDKLSQVKMVAGSKRIAQVAMDYGWKGDVLIAESPANKDMMITFSG